MTRPGATTHPVRSALAAGATVVTGAAVLGVAAHRRALRLPAGEVEQQYERPGAHEVVRSVLQDGTRPDVHVLAPVGGAVRAAPLVLWGNGSRATPAHYDGLLTHLASWGLVVAASASSTTGTGADLLHALERVLAAADDTASPLHGVVDAERVAAAGHSQGAGGAVNATRHSDGRVGWTVTVSLPRRRWVSAGDEYEPGELVGPSLLLTGTADLAIAGPSATGAYFDEVPGAAVTASLRGAGHNEIQGTGGRFLGCITAWLRSELCEDGDAAAMFRSVDGAAPQLATGPRWSHVRIAARR